MLGEHLYEDPAQRDAKCVLLEMLHSCRPISNKETILKRKKRGVSKFFFIATITFGMGVDCWQVH